MEEKLKFRFDTGLTDAERERLAWLFEECAEVIQIIGKISRHGYESYHPDNPSGPNNRQMLDTELGHVAAAVNMMSTEGDLDLNGILTSSKKKAESVHEYLHFQDKDIKGD